MSVSYEYALNLRPYLEGFVVKKTNPLVANFRCPLCGDSKRKKNKKRGYLMQKGDRVTFFCHKCQETLPLGDFIKKISPALYSEYRMSGLTQRKTEQQLEKPAEKHLAFDFKSHPLLTSINHLPLTHFAREYLEQRMIPPERFEELYLCSDFGELLECVGHEKVGDFPPGKQRIIIPFLNASQDPVAFQGRALDPKETARYITVKLDESFPQIYGLDHLNLHRENFWVFEGPFDSMFIDNGLAMAGSHKTELFDAYFAPYKDKLVFVMDNERRSKNNIKHVRDLLDQGYRVMIWPNTLQNKDLNKMIQVGELTVDSVESLFKANIHKGLGGLARLSQWSKI